MARGRALGRDRDGQAADQGGPRRARDLAADPRQLARRPHRARQLASAGDRRRRRLDPRPAGRRDPPRPGGRADRDPARQRDRPRRSIRSPRATAGAERGRARGGLRGDGGAGRSPACLERPAEEEELAAHGAAQPTRAGSPVRPRVALTGRARSWPRTRRRCSPASRSCARPTAVPDIAIDNVKLFFDGVIEYPTQTAALLQAVPGQQGHREGPEVGAGQGPRADLLPAAGGQGGDRRRSTPPAGRSTCTRSATARCARRSTRSSTRAAPTGAPTTGTRSRHLELVHPKDFRRFAKLGVLASMQMQWAERDSYTVDRLKRLPRPKR